jgi:dTDP-4-amino-4,6-dideoxygalactose transaminase
MTRKKTRIEIPLFDLKLSAAAKREAAGTLASGWLSSGPKVAAFEKEVARVLKTRNAVALNSATAALQATLTAIGIGSGNDVITTPFTFVATLEAIIATGASPVLADINPETLNIDPDEVDRKRTDRTAAIVPVDIAGSPCDYAQLVDLCEGASMPLIADSAHAFGALYQKKSIAQVADAAVYSFYATKNLTCGEGGLVASRHKELVDAVRLLSRHGLTSNAYQRRQSGGFGYDAATLGTKAGMSELHAAVGLGELSSFEKNQAKRVKLVERYHANLKDLGGYLELPYTDKASVHSWHLFIIRLHLSRFSIDRNRFISELAKNGIECGVHYAPIFELSFYREALGLTDRFFPNAAYAGKRVATLPLYPTLKLSQVDRVCQAIRDVARRFGR